MLYFTAYLGKVHAIPVTHKIKQSAFLVASDLHWTIRPPQERENPVETVDDCLESIEVGTFVAVNLSNCDKVPVIGKVLEVAAEKVKIIIGKGHLRESGVHKMFQGVRRHRSMSCPRVVLSCAHSL